MQDVKKYLIDLIHQIRIGVNPAHTFEQLDRLGLTFRIQMDVCKMAETTNLPGYDIANAAMKQDYLFRYPEGTKTEYIEGYGLISEEGKKTLGL